MNGEENHIRVERERGYNGRDAVKALRASVESTEDRDELRMMDSQLRQLLIRIRDKMRVRASR